MSPRVFVSFGTGGVGKTTVSAALGTALARQGLRTLVITCDPARRLAEAFGVRADDKPVQVGSDGRLWCFMPETKESARRTVALLFGDDPQRLASLQQNPVLATLVDGLSGMHELGALAQLVEASAGYDAVVVDTAPTRHALELLSLPERVIALVDSRALRWLGDVSRKRLKEVGRPKERGALSRLLDWGQSRIVSELEESLGGAPVAACMELLTALMDTRPALSRMATSARELLAGDSTTFLVVASPREGALADVTFFYEGLSSIAHGPRAVVLNRDVDVLPAWTEHLSLHPLASERLRSVARLAGSELSAAARQSRETRRALAARYPALQIARIARMDASVPEAVVQAAAGALAESGLLAHQRQELAAQALVS